MSVDAAHPALTRLGAAPDVSAEGGERRRYLLFAGLAIGLLLAELDHAIFATALPTVVGELDGVDRLQWVNTAYILAGTVVMPVYGRLGDLLGRRTLFIAALSIFLLGSVVGGLAQDMSALIVGRAIQGLGGGGLLILIQAIVADVIAARRRAPYLTALDAVFALSAVLGPVIGGWLTENVGWRWAFWINLPLGAVAIAAAVRWLPRTPRGRSRGAFDLAGSVTLAAALTAVVLVASWGGTRYPWSSPMVTGLVVVAVVAIGLFMVVERRAAQPVLPLSLFADRNFTVTILAGLLLAFAMFGTIGYLPTYLQMVSGASPTRAGLMMLYLVAGLALTTVGSAQVISRTGRYKWLPVLGAAVVTIALTLLSTLTPDTDLKVLGAYLLALGAGIGCAWEVLVIVVQNTVPADRVGIATAANGFFREIGVLLGTAVVGAVFTGRLNALFAERLPVDASSSINLHTLTPGAVSQWPDDLRAVLAGAYNDALTPIFVWLVPLMVAGVVGLCLIKPVPLLASPGNGSD